jgi:hypothetical protein
MRPAVYVLIVISFIAIGGMSSQGGGGTSIETVEFRSKDKCEAAKEKLDGVEGELVPFSKYQIRAFCQSK